jgi:ATP-dependent 26S proteasome regulatory subunit
VTDTRAWRGVDIPLPDEEAARALVDINLRGVKLADDVDRGALAERLAGYSGADITNVRVRVMHVVVVGPRAETWLWWVREAASNADLPRRVHDGHAPPH